MTKIRGVAKVTYAQRQKYYCAPTYVGTENIGGSNAPRIFYPLLDQLSTLELGFIY